MNIAIGTTVTLAGVGPVMTVKALPGDKHALVSWRDSQGRQHEATLPIVTLAPDAAPSSAIIRFAEAASREPQHQNLSTNEVAESNRTRVTALTNEGSHVLRR